MDLLSSNDESTVREIQNTFNQKIRMSCQSPNEHLNEHSANCAHAQFHFCAKLEELAWWEPKK